MILFTVVTNTITNITAHKYSVKASVRRCRLTKLKQKHHSENFVVLLSAPPSTDNGGGDRHPFTSTSTGAVQKPVTLRGVFILVQLNKCVVVYGSVLQMRHTGDG